MTQVSLAFEAMAGRRVFVSGVGGELGTLIADLLEAEPWVDALAGIDADPPRRRLTKTIFHRIPPDQHDRIVDTIAHFNPHVLVHVGVWEPDARAAPASARILTDQAATSIIGAAAECPASSTSSFAAASRSTGGHAAPSHGPTRPPRSGRPAIGAEPSPRSSTSPRESVIGWASPSAPCGWHRCSGRTSRHRSADSSGYRRCPSAPSPTLRSPSSKTATPPGRSSPRPASGSSNPSTSSPTAPSPASRRSAAVDVFPFP